MLEYYSPGFEPIKTKIIQIATSYTITSSDTIIEVALTTPAAFSMMGPKIAGLVVGKIFTVVDANFVAGTYPITITPSATGQLINNTTSYVINTNGGFVSFYFDGTNLVVCGSNASSGGGSPGGSSGQVQYNNGGLFAGSASIIVNSDGTLNAIPEVIAVTGTTKTLALTDANSIQACNNASAQMITIPTNASVAFPIGTTISFEQDGAGTVTVAGAGGVTFTGIAATSAQYSGFYIRKTATNTWIGIGGSINSNLKLGSVDIILNNGSSVIPTGVGQAVVMPYAGSFTGYTMFFGVPGALQTGSAVIDIYKVSYAGLGGGGSSITGGSPPTISGGTSTQVSSIPSWTVAFNAGDIIYPDVLSASTITQASLTITATKS